MQIAKSTMRTYIPAWSDWSPCHSDEQSVWFSPWLLHKLLTWFHTQDLSVTTNTLIRGRWYRGRMGGKVIDGNKSPAHSRQPKYTASKAIYFFFHPTFHILLFSFSFSSLKLWIFLHSLNYRSQTYAVHLHHGGVIMEECGARGDWCLPKVGICG